MTAISNRIIMINFLSKHHQWYSY